MKNKFQILSFLCLAVGSSIFAQQAAAEEPPVIPDYIRYQKAGAADQADVLETAVSRFKKGNHVIDLIAVVHLGDSAYFEKLNEALKAYDVVYYEMVGGPYTKEKARQAADATASDGNLAQVQALQKMAMSLLGLEFQLDQLDYLAPNFVHADMTAQEFTEHSKDGADLSNMLARAIELAQSGTIKGMPSSEAEINQMMSLLFGAVLSGDSNQLKRSLAPILSEAESFISQLEGEEGSVLISKRNQIVIDKVHAIGAARSAGKAYKDSVLYGAGHMPDLEKRLLAEGYTKQATTWEDSWTIQPGVATSQNTPSLPDMMKQLGGLMEMIKGAQ